MTYAIRVHGAGGPEVLTWEKVEVGKPAAGEVRLKHRAIGLNFIDVYHRTGLYPMPTPFVPGMEGAGEVEAVGEGVSDLKPGDRVAYAGVAGAYAESRLIKADRLVKIPDSVSFEQAAAVMLQGMTAHMLVRKVYAVSSADTVLVHAAAGGTGLLLCQWAASLGATVIGTVSSKEKAELAARNGCTHPVLYKDKDFVEEVLRITGGKKLPVVYDSVGKSTFLRSLDCLAMRGLMVSFGNSSGPADPFPPGMLAQKGSLFLTRPLLFHYIEKREELVGAATELFELMSSGKLKAAVNQRHSLKDVATAHRQLEEGRTTGSTVLTLD